MENTFVQLMRNMDKEMERTKKLQSEVRLTIKGAIALNQQFKGTNILWGKMAKK